MCETEIDRQKWLDMALVRSSDWFKIHSEQRIKLFNFFVVIFLAMVAAYAAAVKDGSPYLQILAGSVTVFISLTFQALDNRTSLLIKDSEVALMSIDAKISAALGTDFLLVVAAENKRGTRSYRQVFSTMYIGALIFGIGSIVFALFALATATNCT